MSRLRLRFVARSVEQLERADEWWRANRARSPDLLITEFDEAVALLRDAPHTGVAYPNDALPGVRRFLMRRTRFHVYYVVRDDTLIISALWSGLRDHGPPLSSLGR